MAKKILIVGGVAGGASVAARARRLDESAQIIMFERGPDVSFSNCCLPFHLSGTIENCDDLILLGPEDFKIKYNIDARTNNEVIKIKPKEKKVIVRDIQNGNEYEESYDKLVLSPGASPIIPKNIDRADVFTIRNVVDIRNLNTYIKQNNIEDIAVVGGGFIGVEVAENLRLAGKNVTLIEAQDQIMPPFDYDMAQILHKEMLDKGVTLILEDGIVKVEESTLYLRSGKEVQAGAIVMAIGVSPETSLAIDAGLEIGKTGAIKVDHNYLTSDKDIYAVGDAIEIYNRLTQKEDRLPLAGPAQRQARAAADHINGIPHKNHGVIGSSVIKIFDINAASTGLNEKTARAEGIPYYYAYIIANDKVGLMPNCHPIHFKLIYEYPSGRILGAQAIGKGNVDKRIDIIATMIHLGGSLEDLKELELCYAPSFGTARDIVNIAALVGLNTLSGRFRQVPVSKARELVERDAIIIDIREKSEYHAGHLKNAINIPLSQLRDRVSEIPKDKPVYLHCRSSQRSYNAMMALNNLGYDNLYDISGSFLGISYYEYFRDKMTGRDRIVTEYNFR